MTARLSCGRSSFLHRRFVILELGPATSHRGSYDRFDVIPWIDPDRMPPSWQDAVPK